MTQWLFAPINWAYWQPRLVWLCIGAFASSFAWLTVIALCASAGRADREMREIWRSRNRAGCNLPQEKGGQP